MTLHLLEPGQSPVTVLRARDDDAGKASSAVRWHGNLRVPPLELSAALRDGWGRDESTLEGWDAIARAETGDVLLVSKPNLVVDAGVQRGLDSVFAASGRPVIVDSMGVDSTATNPTAATNMSGAAAGAKTILAFDSAPTRAGNITTCLRTFTQATVPFVIRRLFLSAGTADSPGSLYAMTNAFTLDYTVFSTWQEQFSALVTGTGA